MKADYIYKAEELTLQSGIRKKTSQNSRLEYFTITMPQLENRQRNIQVYIPPGYDTSNLAYPVFYLHNAEYLFNPILEDRGDYKIDETLDRLFTEGVLDGMIVVGIEHNPDQENPWDEYTPWINENMHDWVHRNNSDPAEGGEGFTFLDFIVSTLKPEIDSRYRTQVEREYTAIGGFCRSALIPLLAGLKYPEVFSMVMSMSPSVWLAEGGGRWLSNNRLIDYINEIDSPKNVRFFIHIGTEESSGNRPPIKDQDGKRITYPQAYVEGAEAVYTTLLNNGVPASNIYFEVIEGSSGGRDLWGKRFEVALLWLLEQESLEDQGTIDGPIIEDIQNDEETKPLLDDGQGPTLMPSPTDVTVSPTNIIDKLNPPEIAICGSILLVSLVPIIWLLRRR